MTEKIVIANCGGFWGDDPTAARRQVEGGPIDYLVMDYLAEVTMAILQKQKARKPELGYAGDFITQMRDVLVPCMERGVTIIANAGGVNPHACGAALEALAAELGVADKVKLGASAPAGRPRCASTLRARRFPVPALHAGQRSCGSPGDGAVSPNRAFGVTAGSAKGARCR